MGKYSFREYIKSMKSWTMPASAMPVIVTVTYLFWKGAEIDWVACLLAMAGILLFHKAGNILRESFNSDKAQKGRTFIAIAFVLVSVACLVTLLQMTGVLLLWLVLAGLPFAIIYPWVKSNVVGDFCNLSLFALLPALAVSFVSTGSVDWTSLVAVLPAGLIISGISRAGNIRDIAPDTCSGVRTLIFSFEMYFPYFLVALLSIAGIFPVYTVIIFLTLPPAIGNARMVRKSLKAGMDVMSDMDTKTSELLIYFSVFLSISFAISTLI